MVQSIYNLYLLYTTKNNKAFGIIGFQINNTFIITNKEFTDCKQKEFKNTNFIVKEYKILISSTPFKFNNGFIT